MNRIAILLGQPNARDEAAMDIYPENDSKTLNEFATKLMSLDGSLILDIIEENVSVIAVSELTRAAWFLFRERKEIREEARNDEIMEHDSDAVNLLEFTDLGD